MKKKVLILFTAGLMIVPLAALAAFPIVPCGETRNPCKICHIPQLLRNIVDYLSLVIAPVLAAGLFAWAGIVLLTSGGNETRITLSREIFFKTVIGLLIVYASWMIINEIMVLALRGGQGNIRDNLPWSQLPACPSGSVQVFQAPPQSGLTTPPSTTPLPTESSYSESQARQAFSDVGIPINKNPCPLNTPYQNVSGGCTSLACIQQATVNEIISLKNICRCPVTVTGGTELGHGNQNISHASGYKVDLSLNPQLDSFITSNYPFTRTRNDGSKVYTSPTGTEYASEGPESNYAPHWDVTVRP